MEKLSSPKCSHISGDFDAMEKPSSPHCSHSSGDIDAANTNNANCANSYAKTNCEYDSKQESYVNDNTTTVGKRKGLMYYHDLISRKIVKGLETVFYRYGKLVSTHPKKVIGICVIVPLLLAIVIVFKFEQNEDFNALMLPKDSRILTELDWLEDQVGREDQRPTRMIIKDKDILTRTSLTAMLDLYEGLFQLRMGDVTMETLCVRLGGRCFVESVLSLWRYNRTVIEALTTETIIHDLNIVEKDPTYFMDFNASRILAGVTRNASGHIVAAQVTVLQFLLLSNVSTEDTVHDFEDLVIDLARAGHNHLENVYIFTTDVLFDEYFKAVYRDVIFITIGMPLVLLHITASIGKFNFIEHAVLLTAATLGGVMMSMLATIGLCLAMGLDFGAPHNALVFLLLGIGVDDVFVIMASWERVHRTNGHVSVEERIGLTMKHAGVSVTVTSVSDFAAFATGILTVAPIMSSFAVYSAVGIMILYVIQCSLFPACLTLNQYRIDASRNACCVCYKHDDWKPNRCSDVQIIRPFFKNVFVWPDDILGLILLIF